MNLLKNKKFLTLGVIVLLIILIPIVVVFLRQQTRTQSEAEQSTALFFVPETAQTPLQKNSGDEFSLDIMVNPGQNLVTLVKINISFDPATVGFGEGEVFEENSESFPKVVEGPIYEEGSFSVTLSIGNDPSRALSNTTKVGTLNLQMFSDTGESPTEISFTDQSQVFSTASEDQASENVLSGTSPAYISSADTPNQAQNCTLPENNKPGEVFAAILNGDQVVPSSDSNAVGRARVVLPPENSITNLTYVSFCYEGLPNISRGVRIHYPAPAGENAGNERTLPVSGFPSGSINNFPVSIGENEKEYLRDGLWYIEIETINNDDGEIRGQFGAASQTDTPSVTPSLSPSPEVSITQSVTPTLTSDPTPTTSPSNPQGMSVLFTANLHGIGSSGDNSNPTDSSQSNKNPIQQTRNATIEVYDAQEQKITETQGSLTYSEETGNYAGTVTFDETLSNGSYLIKIHVDTYLRETFTGIQTITSDQTTELPTVTLTAGDVNRDNILDARDYNLILGCYSDLLPAKACDGDVKQYADIQNDGEINQIDYNLFLRELSFQTGD